MHSECVVGAAAAAAAHDAGADNNDQRIDGILSKMRPHGIVTDAEGTNRRHRRRLHVDDLSDDERYLLGATALDCSLMITFRRAAAAHVDR